MDTFRTPHDNTYAYATTTTSFDPKLMAAITAVVLAIVPTGYGAWRALSRSSALPATLQAAPQEHDAAENDTGKSKRSKERRKRAPGPKLQKGALASGAAASPVPGKKAVVRQPSALPQKRKQRRASSIAVSEPSSSNAENYSDETPRQAAVSRFEDPSTSHASTSAAHTSPLLSLDSPAILGSLNAGPENVPLPPSPLFEPFRTHSPVPTTNNRQHSPSASHRRDPSPSLGSPGGSTTASTSGTPLTPSSLATSQVLPLPSLHLFSADATWDWAEQTPIPQPAVPSIAKDDRGRSLRASKALAMSSPQSARSQELTFPTLNPIPPPSTPIEDQVHLLRESVEASRVREQAARTREEALSAELDRFKSEAEQARQEVARMQWHLYQMAQRDEQWQSQLHAMHLQLQAFHHSRQSSQPPITTTTTTNNSTTPAYPMTYPPSGVYPYYYSHPYPPPSPMSGPQPSQSSTPNSLNSLLSPPTQLSNLPPLAQSSSNSNVRQGTPSITTPLDTMPVHHPVPVYHPLIPAAAGMPNFTNTAISPSSYTPHSSQYMGHYHQYQPQSHSHNSHHQHTHQRANSDIDLNAGLIEAIMKRPESLRSASTGTGTGGGHSNRSASQSVSGSNGVGSRSGSVTGRVEEEQEEQEQQEQELEGIERDCGGDENTPVDGGRREEDILYSSTTNMETNMEGNKQVPNVVDLNADDAILQEQEVDVGDGNRAGSVMGGNGSQDTVTIYY